MPIPESLQGALSDLARQAGGLLARTEASLWAQQPPTEGSSTAADPSMAVLCGRLTARIREFMTGPRVQALVLAVYPRQPESIFDLGEWVEATLPNGKSTAGIVVEPPTAEKIIRVMDSRGEFYDLPAVVTEPGQSGVHTRPTPHVVMVCDSRIVTAIAPDGFDLKTGDSVWVNPGTYAILDRCQYIPAATIGIIQQILPDHSALVDIANGTIVAMITSDLGTVEEGMHVAVDRSSSVIVSLIPALDPQPFGDGFKPVSFKDIGGHREVIATIVGAIGTTYRPEVSAFYGKDSMRGFVLHGPGGTGKTIIARAIYSILAEQRGEKTADGAGFFLVDGPEILRSLVGLAEAEIRSRFARARKYHERTGRPALVVFDEAEAIAKARGTGKSSDVNDTLVSTLLVETSSPRNKGVVVCLITNRLDIVDPQLIREGRFDYKFYIGRPNREEAKDIFAIHLGRERLTDEQRMAFADLAANDLYRPDRVLYRIAFTGPDVHDPSKLVEQTRDLTLSYVACGAMIEGIVKNAKARAKQRDQVAEGVPIGITPDLLLAAVEDVMQQQVRVNMDADLKQLTEDIADRILKITPILRLK